MRWVAGTLLALLGLAWVLLALAAPSVEVRPAPDDRGLGGLSLFAAALRDAGYQVAFDKGTRPRLAKEDVAIVPMWSNGLTEEYRKALRPALRHVERGGRALFLGIPSELAPVASPISAKDYRRASAQVVPTPVASDDDLPLEDAVGAVTLWRSGEDRLSRLAQLEKGRIAVLGAGALATNRFLPRADDARIVLSTLAAVARPGDRLVFVAGGYGGAEPLGPIEAIGPWAVGALWQTFAVMAAYGLARGIRFGLAAPVGGSKRGSRELLDALAGLYRRGRHTDAPLAFAARERPDDAEVQALAARPKPSEADALRALAEIETRGKPRR